MDEQVLMNRLRTLNSSEIFYRNYRLAKASAIGLDEYLASIDKARVYRENLLVPEWKDTIPPEYLEDWYFSSDSREGIHIHRLFLIITISLSCFLYLRVIAFTR